jgi:mono/diheme cytochrome c family protein
LRARLYTRWALLCAASLVMLGALSIGEPLNAVAQAQPTTLGRSSNPLSGNPEAIEQGRKLYFTWCVQCHGPKADGRSRFGEYAKDLRQFSLGYSVFFATVVAGRPEKKMPPWGEYLSPEDIQRIGAYLETLAIAGANWKD